MESLGQLRDEIDDILVKTKEYKPQFDHLRKHDEANSEQSSSNKAEGHKYPPITMAELDEKLKITDLNFKHNDDILRAIEGVIEQIERKLCTTTNYEYNGKCYLVGSSRDGTRPGNLEEFDFVYMNQVEGLKLYGDENDRYNYKAHTAETEREIDAKFLNELFQDSLDELFKEHIELPENLSHAGFASPHFSGVRRMGPAATLLFCWKNDTEISIDLATVLPIPSKKADEIRDEIREKLKHIQSENAETYYDVNNLMHLVGKTPGQRSWELSTTQLECEIIRQLHETAPAKKAIKYGKIVYEDYMKNGIAIAQDTSIIEHDRGDAGETIITLLESYQSGEVKGKDLEELREDIMKIMRYAHIFIPPEGDSAFHGRFHELTKSPVGIRSYAMKHLIFTEASKKSHSGSFQPTKDDRKAAKLLSAVFHQLHVGNKVHVQHYFFERKQIPFLSWAEHTPNERDRMAKDIKDHCGVIKKKIQKKKTSKPYGQRKDQEADMVKAVDQGQALHFCCIGCNEFAFTLDNVRRFEKKHYIVLDQTIHARYHPEEFNKFEKTYDNWRKTHDLYCGKCKHEWGNLTILTCLTEEHRDIPMMKIKNFIIQPGRSSQSRTRYNAWSKFPFRQRVKDFVPDEMFTTIAE